MSNRQDLSQQGGDRVLSVVRTQPDTLIHTGAERRLAVEHWLLATLDERGRKRAREEWAYQDVALLPLGGLLHAVRIPEPVVHALVRIDHPRMVAEFLAAALEGGPVIYDRRHAYFYALVPSMMSPERWTAAAHDWRSLGIDILGKGVLLGIPQVAHELLNGVGQPCSWAVPMASPGELCAPGTVAKLIAVAARRMFPELGE